MNNIRPENKEFSEKPYRIVLVKHIPSGTPYVPADRIIAEHSWGPGDGRDYNTVFQDLNQFTAQAVSEWDNPASTDTRPVSTTSQSTQRTPSTIQTTPSSPSKSQTKRPVIPLDPATLEKAPGWKPDRTGKADWNRASELPALRDYLLTCKDKTAVLGNFRYKVWGSSDDMLSRWPHKET